MRRILLSLIFLSLGIPAYAQNFSGRSGGDVFVLPPFRLCLGEDNGNQVCMIQSGANIEKISNGSLDFALVSKTVATLPPASTNTGRVYRVTDGTNGSDCITGGGSTSSICFSNGSSWITISTAGIASFNNVTSGTNTTAALTLGSGASLLTSGTGINQATGLSGTVSVSANTTLTNTNCFSGSIAATTGLGGIILTLPTAVGFSGICTIVKVDSAIGNVTINTVSSQKINGLSSYSLTVQYQWVSLQAQAGNWTILSALPGTVTANLPTTPNSLNYFLTSMPSSGTSGQPTWGFPGVCMDAQTGTSYTIGNSSATNLDRNCLVTFNNSNPVAVTLPQAGTSTTTTDYTHNYSFGAENLGAGTVTITPTVSVINYGTSTITSLQVLTGQTVYCYSDNVNYTCSVVADASIAPISPKVFGALGNSQSATGTMAGTTTLTFSSPQTVLAGQTIAVPHAGAKDVADGAPAAPTLALPVTGGGLLASGTFRFAYKWYTANSDKNSGSQLSTPTNITTDAGCPLSGNKCLVTVTVAAFPANVLSAKVYGCFGATCTNFILQAEIYVSGGSVNVLNMVQSGTLASPAAVTATTAANGGTIAAGTYRQCVTWVMYDGYPTACSSDATSTITTTGTTSTITIPFPTNPPQGALAWLPWVSPAGGAAGTELEQQVALFCTVATGLPVDACALGQNWTATAIVTSGPNAGASPPATTRAFSFPYVETAATTDANLTAAALFTTVATSCTACTTVTLSASGNTTSNTVTVKWGSSDSTAIANAITAAQAAGNGVKTVFVPAGNYTLTSGLTISGNGVTLQGVPGQTTLTRGFEGGSLITITGQNDIVQGITFDGQVPYHGGVTVTANGATNPRVLDSVFTNSGDTSSLTSAGGAIAILNTTGCLISRSIFTGGIGAVIDMQDGSATGITSRCIVSDNYIDNTGTHVQGTAIGVNAIFVGGKVQNIDIHDNYIIGTTNPCFEGGVVGSGAFPMLMENIAFHDNYCVMSIGGGANSGITLGNASNSKLNGNTVDGSGIFPTFGIESNIGKGNTIIGNTVKWMITGVVLEQSSESTITGNRIVSFANQDNTGGILLLSQAVTAEPYTDTSSNTIGNNTIVFAPYGPGAIAQLGQFGVDLDCQGSSGGICNANIIQSNTVLGNGATLSMGVNLENDGSNTMQFNVVQANAFRNLNFGVARNCTGCSNISNSQILWNAFTGTVTTNYTIFGTAGLATTNERLEDFNGINVDQSTVASRNTALGSTTLTTANKTGLLTVYLYAYDSAAGAGCTGNTTVAWTVSYTDPTNTAQTQNLGTETITTNGGATGADLFKSATQISVLSGTAVTYSNTYTIGAGCTTGPSYAANAKAL